jgi:hypothetical protein
MKKKLFYFFTLVALGLTIFGIGKIFSSPGCDCDDNDLDTYLYDCTETLKVAPSVSWFFAGTTPGTGWRVVHTNCIPDHKVGSYPKTSNPHHIYAQDLTFNIPLNPEKVDKVISLLHENYEPNYFFGITLTGIELDPFPILWWDPSSKSLTGDKSKTNEWICEPLNNKKKLGVDCNNGHPDANNTYHYHGLPTSFSYFPIAKDAKMYLYGYAADGFPIYYKYGYQISFSVTGYDLSDSAAIKKLIKEGKATLKLNELKPGWELRKGCRASDPDYKVKDVPCGEFNGKFTSDYQYNKKIGDLDFCNGTTGWTDEFGWTYYYVVTEKFPVIPRYFRGNPSDDFKVKD